MSGSYLFTSESVSDGHPDKLADRISDTVLDRCLELDPNAKVACETLLTTRPCVIAGEITTKAVVDFPEIARDTITRVGYTDAHYGFDADTCAVLCTVDQPIQSILLIPSKMRANPVGRIAR